MKVLFVSKPNSDNFIRNYSDYFGHLLVTSNQNKVWEADNSGQYDVIIFEWANDMTAKCLNHKFKTKVIVRIHDHEVRKGRIDNINWAFVDQIWFINNDIKDLFQKLKPGNESKSFFLPNAVDPLPFTENISNSKKIGMLSIYARTRKRFDRALALMRLLPDWELTIRTAPDNPDSQEPRRYFNNLKEMAPGNVKWDLRPASFTTEGYPKDDVDEFFSDKDVVLSVSSHEAFHYAPFEGMCTGCMPVIFNWEFGRPREFYGEFVCDSIVEMAQAINDYKPSGKYRKYVVDNFAPHVLIPRLIKIIEK